MSYSDAQEAWLAEVRKARAQLAEVARTFDAMSEAERATAHDLGLALFQDIHWCPACGKLPHELDSPERNLTT